MMAETRFIKRIDDLGRLVIPKEIREKAGLQAGVPVEFLFDDKNGKFEVMRHKKSFHYEDIVFMAETILKLVAESRGVIIKNDKRALVARYTAGYVVGEEETNFVRIESEDYETLYVTIRGIVGIDSPVKVIESVCNCLLEVTRRKDN